MKKFDELVKRADDELGMELFRDRVQLNSGVMEYHLRESERIAAWPHFKTLDDVKEYLDACK